MRTLTIYSFTIVLDVSLLSKHVFQRSFGNQASFIPINCFIKFVFKLENPPTINGIHLGKMRNSFPSIGKGKCIKFSACGLLPIWVFRCLSETVGDVRENIKTNWIFFCHIFLISLLKIL